MFYLKELKVYSISQRCFVKFLKNHRYYGDNSEYEFWLNSDLSFVFGTFWARKGRSFVGFLKEMFSWLNRGLEQLQK